MLWRMNRLSDMWVSDSYVCVQAGKDLPQLSTGMPEAGLAGAWVAIVPTMVESPKEALNAKCYFLTK